MDAFPVGKQVTITVQLKDLNGNALTPTAISVVVVDENDQVVVPSAAVAGPYTTSTDVVVDGPSNLLADGVISGMRTVKLTVTTEDGTYEFTESYLIKRAAADALVLLVNSFQTFNQAVLTADQIPGLNGWNADTTTDDLRIAALSEAFTRISQLGFAVRWPVDVDSQVFLTNTDFIGHQTRLITPEYWQFLKVDSFLTFYPEHFRQALRRAQVVEADELLVGDPVEAKRQAGLLSETIKDSSMMFRSGKPLDLGVSKRAFAYLRGYVQYRATLGRA